MKMDKETTPPKRALETRGRIASPMSQPTRILGFQLATMLVWMLTAVPGRAQELPLPTQVFQRWNSTIEDFTTSDVVLDEAGNAQPVIPMVADSEGNSYITGSHSVGSGSSVIVEGTKLIPFGPTKIFAGRDTGTNFSGFRVNQMG